MIILKREKDEEEEGEGIDDKGQVCCQTPTTTQFWPFLWDGIMKMRERGGSWGVQVKVWWGIVGFGDFGMSFGRGMSCTVFLVMFRGTHADIKKNIFKLYIIIY